jgi:hypothetical protein
VSVFVLIWASPHCLPNFPIEHDMVILAVKLATHFGTQVSTQLRVVVVSVLGQVFVILVQVSMRREVVQSAHDGQLTPVRIQAHNEQAKMDESWSE